MYTARMYPFKHSPSSFLPNDPHESRSIHALCVLLLMKAIYSSFVSLPDNTFGLWIYIQLYIATYEFLLLLCYKPGDAT